MQMSSGITVAEDPPVLQNVPQPVLQETSGLFVCLFDTTSHSSGLHHCPSCQQGFRQKSNCAAHYKAVHMNIKETCPHCGNCFKKLKHHIRDVHVSKEMVKCQQCDKEFPEGRLFKDHMNKTHMKTVDGKPLEKYLESTQCLVCGDTILTSRLTRHMRLRHYLPAHHVVLCPLCGAHVKWLAWHLTKKHKGRAGSLEKCGKCDQFFLTTTALKEHLEKHEEYNCSDCGKEFPSHIALARHLYTIHQRVFNVGKRFKSGRMQWEVGSTARATTYRVVHGKFEEDEEDLDEEVEEESFTVILDQDGNLEKIMTAENSETYNGNETAIDLVLVEERPKDVETEEETNDLSQPQEIEVEIEGTPQVYQVVMPLPGDNHEPEVGVTQEIQEVQEQPQPLAFKDPSKLFERLVGSRAELPRCVGLQFWDFK